MQNNSQTEQSSHDPLGRSPSEIGLEVALSILFCITSVFGNLLVVYVVYKDSRLKSLTYVFIFNLALTDISMASLHMPFWITTLRTGTWVFSEKWCGLSAALMMTLANASVLTMGLIAFNRYIRVVKPALYNSFFPSKRMAIFYCVIVWIASILVATPPLYGWGKIIYYPSYAVCGFDWKIENISYAIVIGGGVINGTTISLFYCYYKIYKTLKESTQNLNSHSRQDGAAPSARPETDVRLLKTCFTVVCVFLMSWGTVSVVMSLETAGFVIPREISVSVVFIMNTSYLVNPIIYGIMNQQFKEAFKRALKLGCLNNNH